MKNIHAPPWQKLSEYPLFEDDDTNILDVLFFLLLFAFAMDISYIPPTATPKIVFPLDSNTGTGGAKVNPVTAAFTISFNAASTLYIKLFWEGAPEGEPSVILYEVDTENERLALRSIEIGRASCRERV